jgi:hypothetical protein
LPTLRRTGSDHERAGRVGYNPGLENQATADGYNGSDFNSGTGIGVYIDLVIGTSCCFCMRDREGIDDQYRIFALVSSEGAAIIGA